VLDFAPGQEQAIQDAVNTLVECSTLRFAGGTYNFNNAITVRAKGVSLIGAGKGTKGGLTGNATSTVFVFTGAVANTNGVDHVGDWFTIRGLALINAKKDALRIESSTNVKIQQVRTEWAAQNDPNNGKYGIYPVKSSNVLVEDCEAYNAADAGIYVGQTTRAIVRRNVAKQNVAGIEIENTKFADVYGNTAEDNTTGLVVFDLPGNPISGTDIKVFNNTIINNNRPNFAAISASSSTVSQVPAGTGTFVLASRRVEVTTNTYQNNNSVDFALLSGLAIEPDPTKWGAGGFNFNSSDVWVHTNTFVGGSGDSVDNGAPSPTLRPLGVLFTAVYQTQAALVPDGGVVEAVVWDGIDPAGADNFTNDVNLCVGANTMPAGVIDVVADLNFPGVTAKLAPADGGPPDPVGAYLKTRHYAQGAAPFGCAGFTPAITTVVLPQ
jgi:parallel beta-helix repeat protein